MTKVHVDLPNHWMVGGESLWATAVEGEPEHYKVENVPYFTYGIAIGDVVRAVSTADHPREVVSVVRPAGHLTIRVMFKDGVGHEQQVELLQALHEEHGVRMEKAFPQFWALSVEEDKSEAVLESLRAARDDEVLDLESGEQRVDGNFDADPDDDPDDDGE